MEENISIEISETNRGKEQIIINKTYKFNFSSKKKNIKNIFNFYTIKQKFFIKMSNKNKLLNIILKSHIFQNAILLLFLQKI